MARVKRVFVFDLDDTLFWTSWAYSRAFSKFHDYLLQLFRYRLIELRTLGTISEKIDLELIHEINPDTGRPYGYSMARFPESLVRTYEHLCERGFGKYQKLVAAHIRRIGLGAFDPLVYQEQGLVAGAAETLDFIRAQGDALILVTKGERLVQDCKIDILELGQWFGEEMYVVDAKDVSTFTDVLARFPDSCVYTVGNSYPSDIAPALAAEVGAIFIPYFTWAGEAEATEVDPRVIQLEDIRGIMGLYQASLI